MSFINNHPSLVPSSFPLKHPVVQEKHPIKFRDSVFYQLRQQTPLIPNQFLEKSIFRTNLIAPKKKVMPPSIAPSSTQSSSIAQRVSRIASPPSPPSFTNWPPFVNSLTVYPTPKPKENRAPSPVLLPSPSCDKRESSSDSSTSPLFFTKPLPFAVSVQPPTLTPKKKKVQRYRKRKYTSCFGSPLSKRERNKRAAQTYRGKRKKYIANLEKEVKELRALAAKKDKMIAILQDRLKIVTPSLVHAPMRIPARVHTEIPTKILNNGL